MSKPQITPNVQLNLQNITFQTPHPYHTNHQMSSNSPKPPLGQKSFKLPKGDCSFRVISPKIQCNSQRSISKSSSSFEKQLSMPDTHNYEGSENDTIIENSQTIILNEKALPQINQELSTLDHKISNIRLLEINLQTLKQWQSELLKSVQQLIKVNQKMIDEQSMRILSPRPIQKVDKKFETTVLQEKLMTEQKRRLATEEQSSKLIQEQEKQIDILNGKLQRLEQQYTQKNSKNASGQFQ